MRPRPVAFLEYRINGQYIIEGLAAAAMLCLGALSFIGLDYVSTNPVDGTFRGIIFSSSLGAFVVSVVCLWLFITIKLPYVWPCAGRRL